MRAKVNPKKLAALKEAAKKKFLEEKARQEEYEQGLNPIRRLAVRIKNNWWFKNISLLLIIVLSVMLSISDPTKPDTVQPNKFIKDVEDVFLVAFTFEIVVVMMADGMRFPMDAWNVMDFVIVALGWAGKVVDLSSINVLRVIRLLRPLRSLKRIESMKRLIDSLLKALPGLGTVGGLLGAFIFMVSLFGLKMWQGKMRMQCVVPDGAADARDAFLATLEPLPWIPAPALPPPPTEASVAAAADAFAADGIVALRSQLAELAPGAAPDLEALRAAASIYVTDPTSFALVEALKGPGGDLSDLYIAGRAVNTALGQSFERQMLIDLYVIANSTSIEDISCEEDGVFTGPCSCGTFVRTGAVPRRACTLEEVGKEAKAVTAGSVCVNECAICNCQGDIEVVADDEVETRHYDCVYTQPPNHGISSFDDLGKSVLTVVQVITLEGWTEVMDRTTDVGAAPLVVGYFIILVWLGAFFMTHYLLAQICLVFMTQLQQAAVADDFAIDEPSPISKCFGFIKKKMKALRPAKVEVVVKKPPMCTLCTTLRMGMTRFVTNKYFEKMITYCILINFSLLAFDHHRPSRYDEHGATEDVIIVVLDQINLVLTLIFAVEHVFKIYASPNNLIPDEIFKEDLQKLSLDKLKSLAVLAVKEEWALEEAEKADAPHDAIVELMVSTRPKLKLGPARYWLDSFNCFDAFIVYTSMIEIVISLISGGEGGSFSVLRTLRLLRILRSLKLIGSSDKLKAMIATTAGSMSAIGNFAVLLLLFLYIFALIGMTMFGGAGCDCEMIDNLDVNGTLIAEHPLVRKDPACGNAYGWDYSDKYSSVKLPGDALMSDRTHFNNLGMAFITSFLVMTRENWQAVLYDTMARCGPGSVVYFYLLIISTNYVLLALFVGTLLENFEKFFLDMGKEDEPTEIDEDEEVVPPGPIARCCSWIGSKFETEEGNAAEADSVDAALPKGTPSKSKYEIEDGGAGGGEASQLIADGAAKTAAPPPTAAPSCTKRFRTFCQTVVTNSNFELSVIINIGLSSMLLAIQHPGDNPDDTAPKIYAVLDTIFLVFFTFEMAIKLFALGIMFAPDAYLRSWWNWLDGFIVVSGLVVAISGAEGGVFRVIRTVRVLRPLRSIQRFDGMRMVATSLLESIPSILTVMALVLFFMIIVSIFFTQLFKGTMHVCNDATMDTAFYDFDGDPVTGEGTLYKYTSSMSDYGTLFSSVPKAECIGVYVDEESGEMTINEWQNGDWNFDHLGVGLLVLFELFSLEAWPDILLALFDATDTEHGPEAAANPAAAPIFIIVIMFGAFFLLNLFVGVIVTAYNEVQRDEPEDPKARHMLIRAKDITKLVLSASPERKEHLRHCCRGPFIRLVEWAWFEPIVMMLIMVNVLAMAVDWCNIKSGESPEELTNVTDSINSVFSWIFLGELVIKNIALLPWNYIRDGWNIFDFIIVALSLADEIMSMAATGGSLPLNPTMIRIFRIFRLARLLRLSKKAKGLQDLMKTFVATLPSLGHVGFLLGLFFFMYAVLGVQLFWNVQGDGQEVMGDYADFSSFASASLTLFRISSGEAWNACMHECMVGPPDCDPGTPGTTYMYPGGGTYELGGEPGGVGIDDPATSMNEAILSNQCGSSGGAVFFFLTFILIASMTTMNLIIAVILFAFFDYSENALSDTLEGDRVNNFVVAWAKLDPLGVGMVDCSKIPSLLVANGAPLGAVKWNVAEDLEQKLWDSELLLDRNGKVEFHEFLRVCVFVRFGVLVPEHQPKGRKVARKKVQESVLPVEDADAPDTNGAAGSPAVEPSAGDSAATPAAPAAAEGAAAAPPSTIVKSSSSDHDEAALPGAPTEAPSMPQP